MNGESDKPAAVLIGIADEDASELPPLQPPKSSGKAKKTRQIPNAGILNPELDASNGMSLSYPARESEAQGEPCSIRITRAPDVRFQFLPPVATYAHSASISSALSRSPHGGIEFLPFDTEVRNRSR